jgi:hypothetical protein
MVIYFCYKNLNTKGDFNMPGTNPILQFALTAALLGFTKIVYSKLREDVVYIVPVLVLAVLTTISGVLTIFASQWYLTHQNVPQTYSTTIYKVGQTYIQTDVSKDEHFVYTKSEDGSLIKVYLSGSTIDDITVRKNGKVVENYQIQEDNENPHIEFYDLGWDNTKNRHAIIYMPLEDANEI